LAKPSNLVREPFVTEAIGAVARTRFSSWMRSVSASHDHARPADALGGIVDHLFPVRNPTCCARDRVQYGEHLGAERFLGHRTNATQLHLRGASLKGQLARGSICLLRYSLHEIDSGS